MNTTTTKSYRAVIIHDGGKCGHTYAGERASLDEAFDDRDELVRLLANSTFPREVVVQETITTVTTIDPLHRTEVTLVGLVER